MWGVRINCEARREMEADDSAVSHTLSRAWGLKDRMWWRFLTAVAAATFLLSCGESQSPLPEEMRELSIDPPLFSTSYCLGRYCPHPLGGSLQIGRNSSGDGWLIERHHTEEGSPSGRVVGGYAVELVRQDAYVAQLRERVDPLSAVAYLKNESYAYKDTTTASEAFAGYSRGQHLSSNPWSQPLGTIGYDEGMIDVRPRGLTTMWVRTGRIVFTLSGGTGPAPFGQEDGLQDALTRGLVFAMSNLLARADVPVEDMILKGNLYFDDQPVPTTKQDVGGDIVFLQGTMGPYMLAIDEFYSKPEYELRIRGTAGLEGKTIEVEFTSDSCGEPRNPSCFATERIAFQPGEVVTVDLHFTDR